MVISASLQACGVVFPFAMPTSICRSIVTICSGLYLLMGMTRFSSKWIFSHFTLYKFRRSRQLGGIRKLLQREHYPNERWGGESPHAIVLTKREQKTQEGDGTWVQVFSSLSLRGASRLLPRRHPPLPRWVCTSSWRWPPS